MIKKRNVLVLCFVAICLLAPFALYRYMFVATSSDDSGLGQLEFALYLDGYDLANNGWMHIMSYSWGENITAIRVVGPGGAAGIGGGIVNMQQFLFEAGYSEYSPKLFQDCASARHIPFAVLAVREWVTDSLNPQKYLYWYFTDVVIGRYSTSGGTSETLPSVIDEFGIYFGKIGVQYWPTPGQLDSVRAGWDLSRNQPWTSAFPVPPAIPWDILPS